MNKNILTSFLCAIILMACSNPDAKEHEYVDLGLSVKWATMNIGASSPEDCGDYFAWGEIKSKYFFQDYNIENYKWAEGSWTNYIKYNSLHEKGEVDEKWVLDLSDDAAYKKWGGSWRMPTSTEIKELVTQCKWECTLINGHNGYKVIGPSGNFIFLPAAGAARHDLLFNKCGYYWSSSLCKDDEGWGCSRAHALFFSFDEDENKLELSNHFRESGIPIRPVCP